jgi:hypothetical protein
MTTNYVQLARDELLEIRAESAESAERPAIDPPEPICGCFPGRDRLADTSEAWDGLSPKERVAEMVGRF